MGTAAGSGPPPSPCRRRSAVRLALAQLNPLVGAVAGNASAVRRAYEDALAAGAELVCATELVLCGYPPEDLLVKRAFLAAMERELERLASATADVPLVVGFVEALRAGARSDDWRPVVSGATPYPLVANSAAVLRAGAVEAVYRKERLPNYGVFDEARYFVAGTDEPVVVDAAGARVGITICEDLWGEGGPVTDAARAGAELVLSLNASPYTRGKRAEREHWAAHHAREGGAWIAYCNQVGGQDEVVFDGDSFVLAPDGAVVARGAQFREDLVVVDLPVGAAGPTTPGAPVRVRCCEDERLDAVGEVYEALVLGTRDYLRKNGASRAWIGLSGGIDSTLVATIAADALGFEHVDGVAMPSPWSSEGSLTDARALAQNLGIGYREIPIAGAMRAFDEALAPSFAGTQPDVAEENVQARIRGVLLMALSNKHGGIVLTTGNKSEYAVGYATLYGDMAGGFAPIKDVAKTLVYDLCRWRNERSPVIPRSAIDKPPSAELRPGQRDTDSLPPYEVLDPILERYVEHDMAVDEVVADGFDRAVVDRVVQLVDLAEYKRRQAAPGVKVTAKAFGRDRRVPITQGWSRESRSGEPHPPQRLSPAPAGS